MLINSRKTDRLRQHGSEVQFFLHYDYGGRDFENRGTWGL